MKRTGINSKVAAVHVAAVELVRAVKQRNQAIKRTAKFPRKLAMAVMTAAQDQEAEAFRAMLHCAADVLFDPKLSPAQAKSSRK